MGMGKVEKFRGRVIVDGNYAFIWIISQIGDEIKKVLTNRENKGNPEPIRPIMGCDNCQVLALYKDMLRLEDPPAGTTLKTEQFLSFWKEDASRRANDERGLQFTSHLHGIKTHRESEGLMVTGFCYALNALYRQEVEGRANCGGDI